MTRSIDYIVDNEASLDEADALAQVVIADLCKRGVVLPTPQIDDDLSEDCRYVVGPNIGFAVSTFNRSFFCGMNIRIGRNVYDTGELGFDLACPQCHRKFDSDDIDWSSPVGEWFNTGEIRSLRCPDCASSASFMQWFLPPFGFGNLAFEFNEWFLKKEFVDHVSGLLEHRVTWVKSQY